ncbi:hypothetical protein [Sharpea porci]|uniref:hypothetical protein n=1 Tax=Sharpea porci TaxID=2652286 RepID=UPI002A90FF69|nr:hypothetical protein [Sharpea porci]MDY5279831.1 hypothetical protein [Sharpea porci]
MQIMNRIKRISVMFLFLALIITGCSDNNKAKTTTKKVEKKTELALIGTKAKGKYVYHFIATNNTGKNITGLAVKDLSQNQYSENMLKANDVFKSNEKRDFYYNAEAAIKAASGNSDKEMNPGYVIQLTFDDQSNTELHNVPFDDMSNMKFEFDTESSLYYISYKSKGTKKEMNTLDDEKQVKKEADEAAAQQAAKEKAEAKAKAEAEAKAKAAAEAKAKQEAQAKAAANAKAAQAKSQPQVKKQTTQQSNSQKTQSNNSNSSAESDQGCVGDGEMY